MFELVDVGIGSSPSSAFPVSDSKIASGLTAETPPKKFNFCGASAERNRCFWLSSRIPKKGTCCFSMRCTGHGFPKTLSTKSGLRRSGLALGSSLGKNFTPAVLV